MERGELLEPLVEATLVKSDVAIADKFVGAAWMVAQILLALRSIEGVGGDEGDDVEAARAQAPSAPEQRDAEDERRVWVEPTEAGWSLREKVLGVRCQVVERLPLSGAQIAELRAILQTMNADMEAAEAANAA